MKGRKLHYHVYSLMAQLVLLSGFKVPRSAGFESTCESGWTIFENSCYKPYNQQFSWNDAKRECEANHAHLATLTSAEENEFVYQTFGKGKTLWIGLYRNPVDFAWVTGESVSFTNWISASGNSLDEKCVEMTDYSVFHGKWNDNKCGPTKQGFICEREYFVSGLFNITKGIAIDNHVIKETKMTSDMDCALQCLQNIQCKSVNVYKSKNCQLNNVLSKDKPDSILYDDEAVLYEKL